MEKIEKQVVHNEVLAETIIDAEQRLDTEDLATLLRMKPGIAKKEAKQLVLSGHASDVLDKPAVVFYDGDGNERFLAISELRRYPVYQDSANECVALAGFDSLRDAEAAADELNLPCAEGEYLDFPVEWWHCQRARRASRP